MRKPWEFPGVIQMKNGTPVHTEKGAISESQKVIEANLLAAVNAISNSRGKQLKIPRAKKGAVSRKAADWTDLCDDHPFLKGWLGLKELQDRRKFVAWLDRPIVHPTYRVLKRTGRTSAASPNIQGTPRGDEFRTLFVPSPGHYFLIVDYKFTSPIRSARI